MSEIIIQYLIFIVIGFGILSIIRIIITYSRKKEIQIFINERHI